MSTLWNSNPLSPRQRDVDDARQLGRRLTSRGAASVIVATLFLAAACESSHAPVPSVSRSSSAVPSVAPSVSAGSGAVRGCVAAPASCGFPDGSSTGVPAGVALKSSGSLTISTPGAVVSGLDIVGTVTINASGVTLKDCRIRPSAGSPGVAVSYSGVSGVVIENVEIDGGKHSPSSVGVSGSGFTLRAANIHGTGDGVDVGDNVVVRDSWIHDLWVASGDHTDGVQSAGGSNVTITHNTIDATGAGVNSAVIVGADLSPLSNTVITDNLLDGGGYTLYAGSDGKYSSGVITITGNRFGDHAAYGACSIKTKGGQLRDSDNTALTSELPICA